MAVGFKLLWAWPVTVMWLLVPSGGSLVEGFRGVVAARGLGSRGMCHTTAMMHLHDMG